MIYPNYVPAFLIVLGVVILVTCFARNGAMFRTAFTMGLNWLACTWVALTLNQEAPWLWFALFDTMAAIIITVRPAGKMQAAIGAMYVAMILAHSVYGTTALFGGATDTAFYLNTLDFLATAAVALLIGWVGGKVVGVGLAWLADRLHLRKGRATSVSAYLAGVD